MKITKFWPFIVLISLAIIYYWRVFLKAEHPFPGDLLVGAYLPWLDHKWGYPTGVPVKNPLISDVFSQFYIWKSLIAESYRNLQIPFWNPYSYSGYPLMANFHSSVFYPLNIFYVFGDVWGWTLLVMSAAFGGLITMYLYLRQLKSNKLGAVLGALVYAFSGFAISWAQFITAAQAMIWIPVLLLVVEKYFESKRNFYLFLIPFCFFLILTSGHFQILVYTSIFFVAYTIWRWFEKGKDIKTVYFLIPVAALTLGIVAVQLFPTLELTKFGLRFAENIISAHNFGLLPLKNIFTLIAPDYFGNPATGNFFGFFNYHETIFYSSVLAFFVLIASLFYKADKNNSHKNFYNLVAILSLLLGFDTFLGSAIYKYNFPGLSTSDAGRIASYFALSTSVLVAFFISNINLISYKKILLTSIILLAFIGSGFMLAKTSKDIFTSTTMNSPLSYSVRQSVASRNLILPGVLLLANTILIVLYKKQKLFGVLLVALTAFDLFRFGWKYIPFVPEKIIYPETEITSWIKDKQKTDYFRIDRERAEIMPPATWMQYRFMSPSGYDPMARADYVRAYQEEINGNTSGNISRYSELERYDAKALGEYSVKYLLAVKRDRVGRLSGDYLNFNISTKDWQKVYEFGAVAVLENKFYKSHARFVDIDRKAEIISYSPNSVKIKVESGKIGTLLLADSWYPGWKATFNNKEIKISTCQRIFRCVEIGPEAGTVDFNYTPTNFYIYLSISGVSALVTIYLLIVYSKTKSKK